MTNSNVEVTLEDNWGRPTEEIPCNQDPFLYAAKRVCAIYDKGERNMRVLADHAIDALRQVRSAGLIRRPNCSVEETGFYGYGDVIYMEWWDKNSEVCMDTLNPETFDRAIFDVQSVLEM